MPTLVSDGVRLHFEIRGSGLSLFLSHGVIESSESWSEVADCLSGRYRVVAHDARGRGRSGLSGRITYPALAADVHAVAAHLGIRSFLHGGHSMGGRVALEHALAYPEEALALAVVAARAEAPDQVGRRRLQLLAERVWREGPAAAVEAWSKPGEPQHQRVVEISSRNSPEGTAAALEALARMHSLLPRLPELRRPTLIVAGDRDQAYVRSAELMRDAIPGAGLRVLPGVGHFPNLERPQALAEELDAFFQPLAAGLSATRPVAPPELDGGT